MKRWIIILVITLFVVIGVGIGITSIRHSVTTDTLASVNFLSDTQVIDAIKQKLSEDGSSNAALDISISKKRTIDDEWLIAVGTVNSLPQDDESRIMVYVLKVVDNSLDVIAYSGDGFSQNSFSSDVPQKIIDEANK